MDQFRRERGGLSQVELGEPGSQRVLDHAGKVGGRLRVGLVGQQRALDVGDGVSVDARDARRRHQRQQVQQLVAVLAHDVERLLGRRAPSVSIEFSFSPPRESSQTWSIYAATGET